MKNDHKNDTELSIPTAFALNNMAVSLLTLEGCNETALQTFTDAVALVRSSAAAVPTSPDSQVLLRAATTRHRNALLRANAHHGEDDARGDIRHKAQSVVVSPAVTDCDWFALCSTVQPQPASSSSVTASKSCSLTPVSISSAMLDDENGQQDMESFVRKDGNDNDEHDQVLGLGILFYNFGLAHVLAAEPQQENNDDDAHSNDNNTSSCSSTLLSQACHWLQKAELSFATLKDQVSNGWDYETECLARLLQVLTLQALAVVYDRQQQRMSSATGVWRRKARECERIAACLLRQHNEAPSPPMRLLLLSAAGRVPRSSAAAA